MLFRIVSAGIEQQTPIDRLRRAAPSVRSAWTLPPLSFNWEAEALQRSALGAGCVKVLPLVGEPPVVVEAEAAVEVDGARPWPEVVNDESVARERLLAVGTLRAEQLVKGIADLLRCEERGIEVEALLGSPRGRTPEELLCPPPLLGRSPGSEGTRLRDPCSINANHLPPPPGPLKRSATTPSSVSRSDVAEKPFFRLLSASE
jgi:hypothetical protein